MNFAEIWSGTEKLGENTWRIVPTVGDIIELEVEGSVNPYEVQRVLNHYPAGKTHPTCRLMVKYAGPGFVGIL